MVETLGRYRVGLTFNPSGDPDVVRVKGMAAELIDLCDRLRGENGEANRCFAEAMTCFEGGAMWAVKAITKQPREDDDGVDV